jgi:hypothetical protein
VWGCSSTSLGFGGGKGGGGKDGGGDGAAGLEELSFTFDPNKFLQLRKEAGEASVLVGSWVEQAVVVFIKGGLVANGVPPCQGAAAGSDKAGVLQVVDVLLRIFVDA